MAPPSGWIQNVHPKPGEFQFRFVGPGRVDPGLYVKLTPDQHAILGRPKRMPDLADANEVARVFLSGTLVELLVPSKLTKASHPRDNTVEIRAAQPETLRAPTSQTPANSLVAGWQNVDQALDALLSSADSAVDAGISVDEGTGTFVQVQAHNYDVAAKAAKLLTAATSFFALDLTGSLATTVLTDMSRGLMGQKDAKVGLSDGDRLMLLHIKELAQSMISSPGVERALRRIESGYPESLRQGSLWLGEKLGL